MNFSTSPFSKQVPFDPCRWINSDCGRNKIFCCILFTRYQQVNTNNNTIKILQLERTNRQLINNTLKKKWYKS